MSKNIWLSLYSIDEWPGDSRLPRSKWKNPDVTEYDHDRLVRIVNKCLPHRVSPVVHFYKPCLSTNIK